jgi:WD40 repeat protein
MNSVIKSPHGFQSNLYHLNLTLPTIYRSGTFPMAISPSRWMRIQMVRIYWLLAPRMVLQRYYYTCIWLLQWNNKTLLQSSGGTDLLFNKVWDVLRERCVGTLEGHTNNVTALCWHLKHEVLVTGSLDGTVQIWKPTSTAEITVLTLYSNHRTK